MRLKRIRQVAACICFVLVTLLFLDFTGVVQGWFGWLAKIQFIPALLALNFGVVVALVLLTCVFGRVYCSVICPLGVYQDVVSRMRGKYKKNRFRYSPALSWLRYGVLALFVAVCGAGLWVGVTGLMGWAGLLEPYSAYGRMASNLLAPFYRWGNNLLAYMAERMDSYAFYEAEVWMKGLSVLGVALLTFVVLSVLAWRNGRTYCNTICPVGTLLGFLSRYAWLKPVIDTSKCVNCNLCERNCKASCIHIKEHKIDYSRCVACMNCIDKCPKGAIRYVRPSAVAQVAPEKGGPDNGRRSFLAVASWLMAGSWMRAQEKKVDGGLAVIEEKKIPERKVHLKPAGAQGLHNFASHCTACQLCVSACPNDVLRPSSSIETWMQPEMSYERGYCRPECVRCTEVCPNGAIRPLTVVEKSSVQIGHAVFVYENCVVNTDGVECGNCARHCPSGAIQMVPSVSGIPDSPRLPVVNEERCIGCGACENLCPARPFSAIYVEGHETHRFI